MSASKAHIIAQLRQEISLLESRKPASAGKITSLSGNPLHHAFPNGTLPLGGIHEFVSDSQEERAASMGFMSALIAPLLDKEGILVWISARRMVFPPALNFFGIDPAHVLFVDVKKEKEILWATEEALKCPALTAVAADIPDPGFIASRRLQLAAEQTQVTAFMLRQQSRQLNSSACLARWKISPLHSDTEAELPGIHHPRWDVQLLKIRNGKPGHWQLQWAVTGLEPVYQPFISLPESRTKTG